MLEVTKDNFEKEVLGSDRVVMIDFWAPWCVPCKIIAPTIETIATEMKDRVKVGKANVDENPEIATELSVLNIPTLIFFKKGEEVGRLIGVNSKEVIESKLEKVIG